MSPGQGESSNKVILLPAANGDRLSKASLLTSTEQVIKKPNPEHPHCVAVFENGEMTKVKQVYLGFLKTENC